MVSFDVNDFVSHNPSDLRSAFGPFEQSCKKENRAARNRKRVELRIVDNEEAIIERLRTHDGKNALTDPSDISFDLGMTHVLKVFFGLAPKLTGNFCFFILAGRA